MSTMNTDIKGLKQKEENLMEKFWNEETKTGPKIRDIIEKIQKCKEDWERVPQIDMEPKEIKEFLLKRIEERKKDPKKNDVIEII